MLCENLLNKKWIFAKTMPKNPHWYTLRRDWRDDRAFNNVVETMRRVGYIEYYYRKPYTMVNIDNMKYWTMGDPISETILINRKVREQGSEYDAICNDYDGAHKDALSIAENSALFDMLNFNSAESVLDIGCGTGLFLDYCSPKNYLGIDPSAGMLRVFREKHTKTTIQTKFEEFSGGKFDLVVSLFGSASYIAPCAVSRIPKMVKPSGRWFIMFYKPDYVPVTYIKLSRRINHYKSNHLLLGGKVSEFNNFIIVEGINENLP